MNRLQRSAWYNIAVVVTTAAVVGIMYSMVGSKAFTGFALLALLGLDALFFRRKPGEAALGERDAQFHRHAMVLAFWCVGVTCFTLTVMAPYYYGEDGAIPVGVALFVLLAACMLFVLVNAVALLYHYARGK